MITEFLRDSALFTPLLSYMCRVNIHRIPRIIDYIGLRYGNNEKSRNYTHSTSLLTEIHFNPAFKGVFFFFLLPAKRVHDGRTDTLGELTTSRFFERRFFFPFPLAATPSKCYGGLSHAGFSAASPVHRRRCIAVRCAATRIRCRNVDPIYPPSLPSSTPLYDSNNSRYVLTLDPANGLTLFDITRARNDFDGPSAVATEATEKRLSSFCCTARLCKNRNARRDDDPLSVDFYNSSRYLRFASSFFSCHSFFETVAHSRARLLFTYHG